MTSRLLHRALRVALLLLLTFLIIWTVALVASPRYRTRFLVRHIASRNIGIATMCGVRVFYRNVSPEVIAELVDLLSDENPQVRYLAIGYISSACMDSDGKKALAQIEGIEQKLRTAAEDPIPEVAGTAMIMLANFKNEENLDLLLRKLEQDSAVDLICSSTLIALSIIGDAKAVDAVLPFTEDPRDRVRWTALRFLGAYDDPRATTRLIRLVKTGDQSTSGVAAHAIGRFLHDFPDSPLKDEMNDALLEAASNPSFSSDSRKQLVNQMSDTSSKVAAYISMLSEPSAGEHYGTTVDCQADAARELGWMGTNAAAAIPALKKAMQSPGKIREAATEALGTIQR